MLTTNMFFGLTIISLNLACCSCYVAYEIFKGFDFIPTTSTLETDRASGIDMFTKEILDGFSKTKTSYPKDSKINTPAKDLYLDGVSKTITSYPKVSKIQTKHFYLDGVSKTKTSYPKVSKVNTHTKDSIDGVSKYGKQTKSSYLKDSKIGTQTKAKPAALSVPPTTVTAQSTIVPPITPPKFKCPEYEAPTNIGAYEVPTQKDIVLLVRQTLIRMFNTYNEKALDFLKDIKEVTRATKALELNCHGYGTDRPAYHKCVRHVSYKCEAITKGLVSSLESQRTDVEAFTNGSICSVKGMKADPVDLIKTLAKEEVSLEFALPGFLRLLNACSTYCKSLQPLEQLPKKPIRHMTDQDLVIKHFLTKKNYIQLLKESK